MGIPCARTEPFLSAMRAQNKCATWIFLRANPLRGSDTPWSMLTLLMREEDKHSWHSYSNSVFSVPEWNASTAPSRLISSNSCRHVSPLQVWENSHGSLMHCWEGSKTGLRAEMRIECLQRGRGRARRRDRWKEREEEEESAKLRRVKCVVGPFSFQSGHNDWKV